MVCKNRGNQTLWKLSQKEVGMLDPELYPTGQDDTPAAGAKPINPLNGVTNRTEQQLRRK
ncbi:hypothetical protein LINPERHAP1_LOCUS26764, partial [Linum perenne]